MRSYHEDPPIKILPLEVSDLSEVAQIEQQVYTDPWTKNAFSEALALSHYLFLKAVKDGQLAGYCGLQRSFDVADITNVTVVPSFRRQGIAQAMLREIMRQGRACGILRFTLEVRASNLPALSLYKKLGFVEEGVRRDFYRMPREDALILWTRESADPKTENEEMIHD